LAAETVTLSRSTFWGHKMTIKVLGISTSPRANGNSDLLLREALRGASAGGAQTQYLALRDAPMAPCQACNACFVAGACRIQDSFQDILAHLIDTDRLIFATPVHFATVCAQAKALIDRCQCLWARKYVLKQPVYPGSPRDRRAMVIAVGGTKGKKMFQCIQLIMKYWLAALDMTYVGNLFVNQVDEAGAILRRPKAMEEAFRLGQQLVTAPTALPEPETVELF
jgi:multimeric flavodoxin WrbA